MHQHAQQLTVERSVKWQRKTKQRSAGRCTRASAEACAARPERPRLAIFRSLNHIYAQVIDDERGRDHRLGLDGGEGLARRDGRQHRGGAARRPGDCRARASRQGVEQVVFDRGGFRYHGRVKALADAAREAGLNKNEASRGRGGGEDGEEAAA